MKTWKLKLNFTDGFSIDQEYNTEGNLLKDLHYYMTHGVSKPHFFEDGVTKKTYPWHSVQTYTITEYTT